MDQLGLSLCDIQGSIFQESLKFEECSSNIFIRRFMNSSFVNRMDNLSFINESRSIKQILDEINDEYGKSNYGKTKFSKEEMYWIGYLYRYFSYVYQIDSKHIYKIIKGNELRKLYFSYHTLDTMNAIDRILEAKNIQIDKDKQTLTQEGVKILREIRKKKNVSF